MKTRAKTEALNRLRPSATSAFTLVELLVAITIGSIVVLASYAFYTGQHKTKVMQDQVVAMQHQLRTTTRTLAQDIYKAGYDPIQRTQAGITHATAQRITFTFSIDGETNGKDDDADGSTDEADEADLVETVEYTLSGGALTRKRGTSVSQLIDEIDGLEFNYRLKNGSTTGTPSDLDDIRSVRVALLIRSRTRDNSHLGPSSFTGFETTWGPFSDRFRRRLLRTTIHCRNLELKNALPSQ